VVDFTVDLIARIIYGTGEKARKMHSGNLSQMLRLMVLGLVILLVIVVLLLQLGQGV